MKRWFLSLMMIMPILTIGAGFRTDPEVDILKAKSTMTELLDSGERVRMDPDLASAEGIVVGQQVKITHKNNSDKYAIYTVSAFYEDGSDNNDVRMAYDGRQRLDESDSFDGYLNNYTVRTDLTESQCQSNDEYCEFLDETNTVHTALVVMAPHGGVIENYTDEESERVYSNLVAASKNVSNWRCKGWQSEIGAYDAWHITSTEISRDSFTLLDQIGDRCFSYAISFHGCGSCSKIYIGGGGPSGLKNDLADEIETAINNAYDVEVVSSGSYGGVDPDNFVNWITDCEDGGIQIEQPYGARRDYWEDIADAVSDVMENYI